MKQERKGNLDSVNEKLKSLECSILQKWGRGDEKKMEKRKKNLWISATAETCKTSLLPWKSLELLLPTPIDVPATNSSLFPEVVTGLPLLEKRLF